MNNAICLDTRILSQFLSGKESAQIIINKYRNLGYEIYTTYINISEIFYGQMKIRILNQSKIKLMKEFFSQLHPRSMDYDAAFTVGILSSEILKGQDIGWRDLFIAAITLSNGKKIITSNPNHYNRIPNLEIIESY